MSFDEGVSYGEYNDTCQDVEQLKQELTLKKETKSSDPELPEHLKYLQSIIDKATRPKSRIFLNGNKLTSRDVTIILQYMIEKGYEENVKDFSIANNNLDTIPVEIGLFTKLEYFDFQMNKISSLPMEMQSLKLLKELRANSNKLNTVPVEILALPYLKRLHLQNNPIESFPSTIWIGEYKDEIGVAEAILTQGHDKRGLYRYRWDKKYGVYVPISGLIDLKKNYDNNGLTLTREAYSLLKSNPLLFVMLLEDSRAAHDDKNDTPSIFKPSEILKKEQIVNMLSIEDILTILSKGRQELARSYESTFKLLLDRLLLLDPKISHLANKDGNTLRNIISSMTQIAPRYMDHRSSQSNANFLSLLFASFGTVSIDTLVSTYNEQTVMTHILPLLQLAKLQGGALESKVADPIVKFLKILVIKLQVYRNDPTNSLYHLTGLLFSQIEKLGVGIKTTLKEQDQEMYILPGMDEYNTFDTMQRNEENPFLVRMCFDTDIDAEDSYKNWLNTIGLLGETNSVVIDNITYTKENYKGTTIIMAYRAGKDTPISYIFADNPLSTEPRLNNLGLKNYLENITHADYGYSLDFDFVIDRGHAGHEQDGLDAITYKTSLCLIGSCQGYTHLAKVLEQNEDIQYIGTLKTGHKAVNDPYFRSIIDSVSHQKKIVRSGWRPDDKFILEENKKDYLENKSAYQLPNDNIVTIFNKKLQELNRL